MKSASFWKFFDNEAAPQLAFRASTFRRTFEYLDTVEGRLTIVETGCTREVGNWQGDGQSTLLFDKYVSTRDSESLCVTVDISESSVATCRAIVSSRVSVNQDDSVVFLGNFANEARAANRRIDLLYLDSFDLDRSHWYPSAIHHLKELTAAIRCLHERSLVVVDDCPLNADFVPVSGDNITLLGPALVGGKGRLVAEYANAVAAKLEFSEYQAGWTSMVKDV
jgi:hypothetical protein